MESILKLQNCLKMKTTYSLVCNRVRVSSARLALSLSVRIHKLKLGGGSPGVYGCERLFFFSSFFSMNAGDEFFKWTSSTPSLWQEKWVIGFRFRVNRVVYTSFLVTRYTSRRSRDVPFILSQLIFNIQIVRCCRMNDCDNRNELLTTVDSKYHGYFARLYMKNLFYYELRATPFITDFRFRISILQCVHMLMVLGASL